MGKIIWSDESYFRLFNGDGRRLVWRQSTEKFNVDCLIPTHKSGQDGIMVWGCFHKNELGPLVRLDGRVNSRDYINLLQDNLLPYLVLLKIRKILFFKRIMLDGSHGYGPVDYTVPNFSAVMHSKVEDMNKGAAQLLVQMHSAQLEDCGDSFVGLGHWKNQRFMLLESTAAVLWAIWNQKSKC